MFKSQSTSSIVAGVGIGLLTLALVGVSSPAVAGPSEAELMHESMVVTSIDRAKRSVTVQNDDGDSKTIKVPADVKAYEALKVGDKIDVDYYESVALSLLPKGAKPTVSETTAASKMNESGIAGGAREIKASAEVVAIDTNHNKVTLKGPMGKKEVVAVKDPEVQKRLPTLKPGQVVQVTYTEAIAVSIRRPGSPAQ